MTAAQFEDAEGRELVEAIHARKAAACLCEPYSQDAGGGYFELLAEPNPDCTVHFPHVTVPTSTRPIHLPTDKERA